MEWESHQSLRAFQAVAAQGSFTRAAAMLDVSVSALSQTVRQLEAQLGVRLLHRTTRKVGLTEAGQQLLAQIGPALATIDGAMDALRQDRDRPVGTLRLTMTRAGFDQVIAPVLGDFHRAYPGVTLELDIDSGLVDIIERGFDAGIRSGEAVQRDMVAVPVTPPLHMVAVASPDYFARRGRPQHPRDLQRHACLRFRYVSSGQLYRWEFCEAGRDFEVAVDGPMIANDNHVDIQAALAGVGIAFVPESRVREHLAAGALQSVLEAFRPRSHTLYLYYPSRLQMAPKLRVLIDLLQARLRADVP